MATTTSSIQNAADPDYGDQAAPEADAKLAELAEMILQYNELTENLRESHDALNAEVVRLQTQLASTDAQLQRSHRLAALGEMAAGIAHEIRNPLAGIRLYAGMIAEDLEAFVAGKDVECGDENADEKAHALEPSLARAGEIVTAVRGLDGIVNDVLAFSRELRPCVQVCDVRELLRRAVASYRPAIDAADVRVEMEVAAASIEFAADEGLLRQALLNLIRNAVEAMSGASKTGERRLMLGAKWVAGQAKGAGDQVSLTVRDTGGGIAEAHVDRIFNPFFTTRSTGTGLGLAIVHRIVDAHGGTICVYNDELGAVFELRLPHRREVVEQPIHDGVSVGLSAGVSA